MDAVDPYIAGLTIRFRLTTLANIDFSGLSFGKHLPVFFIAQRASSVVQMGLGYLRQVSIFDFTKELVSSLTELFNGLSTRRLVLFIHGR
jgi:aromatic ring-opening dioxygenase LigB subunit